MTTLYPLLSLLSDELTLSSVDIFTGELVLSRGQCYGGEGYDGMVQPVCCQDLRIDVALVALYKLL